MGVLVVPEWVWGWVHAIGLVLFLWDWWVQRRRRPNTILSLVANCWLTVIFVHRILEDRAAGNRVSWLDTLGVIVFGIAVLAAIARFRSQRPAPKDISVPDDTSTPDDPPPSDEPPEQEDVEE